MKPEPTLSPHALLLLAQLREWVQALPPGVATVREDKNPNYGGLLFEVRPIEPNALDITVGLGASDAVDVFWGEDYRWENWKALPGEVILLCEAIRQGQAVEETWRLGRFVLERRCTIQLAVGPVGDGSPPIPAWVKRWARRSVRSYAPWVN